MREVNKLTAKAVQTATGPGLYGDGAGLYLQITETKTKTGTGLGKSWLLRYSLNGKARYMGLGSLQTFSLAEARERARLFRQKLADGVDPIDERRQKGQIARAEAAKRITFREAAEKYIASHRAGWRNEKHADQWAATLTTYAYPFIGKLDVSTIELVHLEKILQPIWTTKTETASRVRGRIEKILGWATTAGYRKGDNPARWNGHLQHMLPARAKVAKVRPQPAMPFQELPAFMEGLRAMKSVSARALEFTILTAARTGEAIGARWSEIDFDAKVWTVPGERMKSGREHRVPLSDRAIEILRNIPREEGGEFVFPGARQGKGLSNMSLLELLRGVRPGLTTHGFRSSFRDWAGDQTAYPREVAEAALAHVIKDKAESAYRRGDALEKRRKLMAAWARYCATPALEGKVLSMTREKAS